MQLYKVCWCEITVYLYFLFIAEYSLKFIKIFLGKSLLSSPFIQSIAVVTNLQMLRSVFCLICNFFMLLGQRSKMC